MAGEPSTPAPASALNAPPPRAPIVWWVVIGLALPAFIVDLAGRLMQVTDQLRPSVGMMLLTLAGRFLVPAIQLAGLAWVRVHRPFAHGVWVGVFSGIGWIIAGLLWMLGEAVQHGSFTGFVYATFFLFALPWEALSALILGALAMLLMRFLPPRRANNGAPPPAAAAPFSGVR